MNKFSVFIIVLILAAILYVLAPILTPFLVGALLAYLVDPLVSQLMRLRLPRILAVITVFLILFLTLTVFILLLIPLIQKQVMILSDAIPRGIEFIQDKMIYWLQVHADLQNVVDLDALKSSLTENWMKAGGVATQFLKTVLHSGVTIFQWMTNLILIPVVTFYLLRDWDEIIHNIRQLLPRRIEPTVVHLATECNNVLSAFFRGQLLVMLSLGVIYSVGLMMIGLQIGLVIGLMAGLASVVPYLGFIVGITIASIAAFMQFGSMLSIVAVCIVFIIGQMLESMLFTPLFVGDRIGLHPVAVIFAVLTGAVLYGFFGVLLALPVAAVVMVMLRFAVQQYQGSQLYQ